MYRLWGAPLGAASRGTQCASGVPLEAATSWKGRSEKSGQRHPPCCARCRHLLHRPLSQGFRPASRRGGAAACSSPAPGQPGSSGARRCLVTLTRGFHRSHVVAALRTGELRCGWHVGHVAPVQLGERAAIVASAHRRASEGVGGLSGPRSRRCAGRRLSRRRVARAVNRLLSGPITIHVVCVVRPAPLN